MIFKISLIGKVNVGKSTLFNKLIYKNTKSIISDIPGITRNRKYGDFIYKKDYCKIIDTGGIINYPNILLSKNIFYQTEIAINESNIILFIIDINNINKIDYEIFYLLKNYNKKIILIINKFDNNNLLKNINLKLDEKFYISAKYNIGINKLTKYLLNEINIYINKKIFYIKNAKNKDNIKIIFIGKSNVGKSTLINRLLKSNRLLVSNFSGTTIESINVDLEIYNKKFTFVDTLGIDTNNKNLNNNIINYISYKKLKKINIVVFIINIVELISRKEILFIKNTNNLNKLFIIIINKMDLLNKKDKCSNIEIIKKKLSFIKNYKIFCISALYSSNIDYLLKYMYKLYEKSISIKLKTKTINDLLRKAYINNNNINRKFKNPKLKYIYIKSNNPLKLVIKCSNKKYINNSYKNYLLNFYKKELNINNIPLKINFEET